jgi:hypothetical protein
MSHNITVTRSKLRTLFTMKVRNLDTSRHKILLQIKQQKQTISIQMYFL